MRYRDFDFNKSNLDVGNAAPTFNFQLTDFYSKPKFENTWETVRKFYDRKQYTDLQMEEAFSKLHTEVLEAQAFEAVHRKHAQFFPEESIQTIRTICSAQFETPPPTVGEDKRQPHQKGEAHSFRNALDARRIDLKKGVEASNTPLGSLNKICNLIAQNIVKRLRDAEAPLAEMLVGSYLGDSMPLTVSGDMICAYQLTGIPPTNDDLKLQARRNPDFWQPETMIQALKKITSGTTDPALTTLLISGEYHRNRMWFGEETAEDVVKETLSKIEPSENIKKV